MLIKPLSIFLVLSLLSANLSGLMVFLGFEVNQSYIAEELCENRDKPQLHCEGKCYLMKKLKQAEEKEQKQERQAAQKTYVQDALIVKPLTFKRYAFAEIRFHIPYSTGIPQSSVASIFHPPNS
jgi:hypothetical protein